MGWKDMKLRAKLQSGFGALALVVLVVSVGATTALSRANDRFVDYVGEVGKDIELASALQGAASRRALAVRDMVISDDPKVTQDLAETAGREHAATQTALANLKSLVMQRGDGDEKDRALVTEIDRIESQYGAVALAIVKLAAAGQRDEAARKINTECKPLLQALVKAVNAYLHHESANTSLRIDESQTLFQQERALLISGAVLAIAGALWLGWWLGNGLSRPLQRAIAVAEAVAAGDLGSDVVVDRADETGQLMAALQKMNGGLLQMVVQIRQSADSISTASREIATGNQDLSSRTEHQASALQETAASMQQMTGTVQQTAESSRQASQLAQAAVEVVVQQGLGGAADHLRGQRGGHQPIRSMISGRTGGATSAMLHPPSSSASAAGTRSGVSV